ncbi:hypothetical protein B0H63DRAFT_488867 [Podospora didyma]|uniref:Uncharacterized protein n=1 Tax=Podospora didyma TaxID=330526 RepID=A0AAE0K266_9PEZI|nr:hypothetical protein B0H63DRAFT_488867 [Podospora didyma]
MRCHQPPSSSSRVLLALDIGQGWWSAQKRLLAMHHALQPSLAHRVLGAAWLIGALVSSAVGLTLARVLLAVEAHMFQAFWLLLVVKNAIFFTICEVVLIV